MNCQIIHDSIHTRPGWTHEYLLFAGEATVGYGSIAVGGPWKGKPTVYEWYVAPRYRTRMFDLHATFSDPGFLTGLRGVDPAPPSVPTDAVIAGQRR